MISVDWGGTKVITISPAFLTLVNTNPDRYTLDLDKLRLELKSLEDNLIGITYQDTHRHAAPVTVGGVTLARVVEIINGYTVTFEETVDPYRVDVIGGNSNVGDVLNYNQVQVVTANSAGLAELNLEGIEGGFSTLHQEMLLRIYKAHFHDRIEDLVTNRIKLLSYDGSEVEFEFDVSETDEMIRITPRFNPSV